MQETWLHTNRRILLLGMILPAALVGIGLVVSIVKPLDAAAGLQIVGWVLLGIGLFLFVIFGWQFRLPRLAYADGALLIYLRMGPPFQVPIEIVEAFLLGTGGGQIPGTAGRDVPMRNLVIRLADSAVDFHRRQVKPALGRWEDGYITIYGTWCEPLGLELANRLNSRLTEVKATLHSSAQEST
ncbi:MAG: hypothetical protein IT427_15205 [Pirellulales bacterium]|nr:hypothetical protein [Pirellulales bacterium]